MTREIRITLALRHYQSRRMAASFQESMFTPFAVSHIDDAKGIPSGLAKICPCSNGICIYNTFIFR